MSSYYTLAVGEGYLKNFGELGTDIGDEPVMTQADLDLAEDAAYTEINSALAAIYDVSGWAASTPAIVAKLAEILGSAYAWEYKYARDGIDADSGRATGLRKHARYMISDLSYGRLNVLDASGTLQQRRLNQNCADTFTT